MSASLQQEPWSDQSFRWKFGASRADGVLARFSYDRATRLLDVGLDFCCERSVAVEAGGAVPAPEDRTPLVADLSGVEVVRR